MKSAGTEVAVTRVTGGRATRWRKRCAGPARVTAMTAREHDRAMALMSHLPQLVSSALAATVASQPDAAALGRVAGAGFGDMTRLAASEWSVWRDILETNPSEVAAALDAFL